MRWDVVLLNNSFNAENNIPTRQSVVSNGVDPYESLKKNIENLNQ